MTTNRKPEHGRRPNHKIKPYVVLQYLLKESDENNTKTAYDIIGFLAECGIFAGRRSIYRDIEEMLLYDDTDAFNVSRLLT